MPQYPSQWTETYTPDNLIVGETQIVSRSYVLAAGQVVARGTVLGQITASGKVTLCLPGATDGSAAPIGIVYDAYDATAGDLGGCGVYEKAEVNGNALILGAGWTLATIHAPLRAVGIYAKGVVTASGMYVG